MGNCSVPNNFVQDTPSDADAVDANFSAICSFVNTATIHTDGSKHMTGPLTLSGNPSLPNHAANKSYVDAQIAAGEQTGFIKLWAADAVPAGYLDCDGRAVSRTTYAALFAVIGIKYGAGNGSTTFNIPDFSRRYPRGPAVGSGPGAKGGSSKTFVGAPLINTTIAAGSDPLSHAWHQHEFIPPYQEILFLIKT